MKDAQEQAKNLVMAMDLSSASGVDCAIEAVAQVLQVLQVLAEAQQEIERLKVDVKQEGYLMGLERAAEIANRLGAYEARNAILFQKEPSHEKTD